MPTVLTDRTDGRTTDHSDVIHSLRNQRLSHGASTHPHRRYAAAAELLEHHDAGLISLDDMPATAALVNNALDAVGWGPFLHNGG